MRIEIELRPAWGNESITYAQDQEVDEFQLYFDENRVERLGSAVPKREIILRMNFGAREQLFETLLYAMKEDLTREDVVQLINGVFP